jgi:thiamine biosynthesis protein ThiC
MKIVAQKENISLQDLLELVAQGKVAIPAIKITFPLSQTE